LTLVDLTHNQGSNHRFPSLTKPTVCTTVSNTLTRLGQHDQRGICQEPQEQSPRPNIRTNSPNFSLIHCDPAGVNTKPVSGPATVSSSHHSGDWAPPKRPAIGTAEPQMESPQMSHNHVGCMGPMGPRVPIEVHYAKSCASFSSNVK
jgi:hypothetical protein